MKRCCYMLLVSICLANICWGSNQPRETDFNFDWKFSLQEEEAAAVDYDDSAWRRIRLPHDWSVEASFDSKLEGCTGYLPGGIGWYRKHFSVNADENQVTYLCFDGVYNNCDVWLNGVKLGFHPYGYSPFYFDITPHLQAKGQNNVLAVKVDRTRYADSRWYTGSGIYRPVKLITTDKLHIPIWGTFVTTPEVSADKALIDIEVKVKNAYLRECRSMLTTEIVSPAGKKVAAQKQEVSMSGNREQAFRQQMVVTTPQRWDTESPNMYRAITSLVLDGTVVDRYETPFSIRTIHFDPNEGFFLNGKNTLIKGVCLHHDGGLVGAAVPKGVWRRRLEKLKEGGCNAIRTAHNPPSEEFLDLCDELGVLVQDEFFDEMDNPKDKRHNANEQSVDYITRGYAEHFQEWAERDLKITMLRDRNHPSIIQWSIGNEIEWTYPRYKHATGYFDPQWSGNYFYTPPHIGPQEIKKRYEESTPGTYVLAETAKKLSAWTREMDTTRPVTANCILPSASHVTGYTDALDMVGYSYRRVVYDYGHKHFPDKPIMGTENVGQWHEWKAVIERPFVSGLFLWTGIAYLGEANGGWPSKGSGSGLLDFAGFKNPSWHMYKTLWDEQPHVYLATQTLKRSLFKVDDSTGLVVEKRPGGWKQRTWGWQNVNEHWNYTTDALIIVEVYSNCEEVELLLNGESLGPRKLADFEDHIYKWAVPFAEGELAAKGKSNGKMVSTKLVTVSAPASISVSIDITKLNADGYDVAHIVAQLVDEKGNPVKTDERLISFKVEGVCKVLGVDNGATYNVQDFQSDNIITDKGVCLLIIQSIKNALSNVAITAKSKNLESGSVKIAIK